MLVNSKELAYQKKSYIIFPGLAAPPQWKIEPHDFSTQEGDSETIECQAQGVPAPKITWTFGL